MTHLESTSPERIWLCVGNGSEPEDDYRDIARGAASENPECGICWCEDATDPLDVEYVRLSHVLEILREGEASDNAITRAKFEAAIDKIKGVA